MPIILERAGHIFEVYQSNLGVRVMHEGKEILNFRPDEQAAENSPPTGEDKTLTFEVK